MGATTASARSGDLELTIAVAGTTLRVALANVGDAGLRAYFAAMSAAGPHHDHLVVELAGGSGGRTLRFTGDRDASTIGIVDLDPGEQVSDELDLAAWALQPINGSEPLWPGAYELTATYKVDVPGAWAGDLSAGPVDLIVQVLSAGVRRGGGSALACSRSCRAALDGGRPRLRSSLPGAHRASTPGPRGGA
jgi:hypothetical protein